LLGIFPDSIIDYITYEGKIDTVPSGELAPRQVTSPYIGYGIPGQFRVVMLLTIWHPTFIRCIAHIGGMSSQKKVRRIHACGLIATMADLFVSRNDALGNLPSEPMCQASIVMPDLSITGESSRPFPDPAIVRSQDIDLLPESFYSLRETERRVSQ
jgi:hypothetical protein